MRITHTHTSPRHIYFSMVPFYNCLYADSFIIRNRLFWFRVTGYPTDIGQEAEYTLDRLQDYNRAHTLKQATIHAYIHSYGQFGVTN